MPIVKLRCDQLAQCAVAAGKSQHIYLIQYCWQLWWRILT